MEAREPRAECDELLAVVQRAVGVDAAQRCTAALRAQGVSAVVDWFVLETADEDLCRELLADVAAAEKLTRVQVAKLRLALRGQSARFYPARLSDEEGERRPLWSSFRRYTLPNPLEVAFVFTNRPGWYRAVFDALDGHRLREAYMEQSQIFMLVSALLLGGLLTLIAFDLGRDQARGPPLHIICLSLNLNAFFTAFCAVLFQLYALHVYLPVHVDNLRDVLRATRMLPMTGGLYFAMSAWGMFLGLLFEAMRPMQGLDVWLFRERDLGWGWRMVPVISLASGFAFVTIPFFIQISGAARIIAHSGALAERPVLPPEAISWSSTAANRSLAAVALSQPNCDLTELYMRHQRVSSAVDAQMANTATRGARLMRRAKQRP